MTEHTKGPWSADKYGVRNVGGYIVALTWPRRFEGQDERYQKETAERESDARLIAAAPDLFAACQLALGAFENNNAIDWSVLEQAIAKATPND